MKKTTRTWRSIGLTMLLATFILSAHLALGQSAYHPNELAIRFEQGTPQDTIVEWLDSLGATQIAISPLSGIRLWHVATFPTPNGYGDILETGNGSRAKSKVNSAGLNYITMLPSFEVSGDPNTWVPNEFCPTYSMICEGETPKPVKVGILDTGVGYEGTSGAPIFCVPNLFMPVYAAYIGHDFVNSDIEPKDDHGHGTHIAGIIAQLGSTDGANLTLESHKTHDQSGGGYVFDIILATDQAVLDGNHILNMSFGYQAKPPSVKPEPLQVAIDKAAEYGVLVVAAAGNYSKDNDTTPFPTYPASFPCENIVSVASVSCIGTLSSFSNYGSSTVHIAMLGEDIVGPAPDGSFVLKSGTSQATAIVTGIAAQLATELHDVHYSPLKCALLDGAQHNPALQSLIWTEGIAHASTAYGELMGDCGIGFRSGDGDSPAVQAVSDYSVSPNPFSGTLKIRLPGLSGEQVQLYVADGLGRLVLKQTLAGGQIFDWQPAAGTLPGAYFVKAVTQAEVFSQMVVFQK